MGREQDFKIKLLKDSGFFYSGGGYLHKSGFEVNFEDFKYITDEDFQICMNVINNKLVKFEQLRKQIFSECTNVLKECYD